MTCQNIHRLSFSSAAGITRGIWAQIMRREPTGAIRLRGFIIRDAISITWSTGFDYAVSKPGDDKAHTKMEGMKMPIRYVCEMFIDRVSASKTISERKVHRQKCTGILWKKRGSLHDSSRYKSNAWVSACHALCKGRRIYLQLHKKRGFKRAYPIRKG